MVTLTTAPVGRGVPIIEGRAAGATWSGNAPAVTSAQPSCTVVT